MIQLKNVLTFFWYTLFEGALVTVQLYNEVLSNIN